MTQIARADSFLPDWNGESVTTRSNPVDRLRAWVELFREVYKAAEVLSKTSFVPKEMLGKPADVAAAVMKGFELGMDPLDSLANIFIVHGRVGMYAEFQRRRIIQAGHTFRVIESSDTRCIVEGVRKEGGEPQRASFSADQARKAGLDLGKYPADKLVARATSRLCRQVFPDVLSGTLIAEDIIDGLIPADDDQAPQVETPARPALQRSRPARKPKAAASQPPTAKPPADDDIADLLDDEPLNEPKQDGVWEVIPTDDGAPSGAIPADSDEGRALVAKAFDHTDELAESSDDDDQLVLNQPEPITPAQLKKLSILLREAGFDDRDSRHGFVTTAINRHIDSAKDLTKAEANHCIDTLESDSM